MKNKILQNSSFLLFAQLFIKGSSFLYTIFLASNLAVEQYGLYTVALSYFGLFSAFSDIGVVRFLIREIAAQKDAVKSILFNILVFRMTTVFLSLVLFYFGIYLFDPDIARINLSLIAVIAVIPQSISTILDGVFVGLEKMKYSAAGTLVLNISSILAGVFLINSGYKAEGAVAAVLIGQLICMLFFISVLFFQKISPDFRFKKNSIPKIFLESVPYGILGILGLLYFKIDGLLLAYLKGAYDAGIYGIAYKFLESVIFLPSVLAVAIFPQLAKLHAESNSAEIKDLTLKITKGMFLFGVLLSALFILVLPFVIRQLLPAYAGSIPALMILSLAIPFMFLHIPLSQILLSSSKYLKQIVAISAINLTFNLVANLLFIPQYGYIGAAWVTVFSDMFSFGLLFLVLHKYFIKNV